MEGASKINFLFPEATKQWQNGGRICLAITNVIHFVYWDCIVWGDRSGHRACLPTTEGRHLHEDIWSIQSSGDKFQPSGAFRYILSNQVLIEYSTLQLFKLCLPCWSEIRFAFIKSCCSRLLAKTFEFIWVSSHFLKNCYVLLHKAFFRYWFGSQIFTFL